MHRFDIEVEGTHNYFVDGVMVHNSPETTPGGRALKFYSSVRLDIRRIESIKDGVEVVGSRTRVKVVKNKVAPPFRQAEFDIMYGKGISREGSLLDMAVDLGIVKKSGAWYTYEGEQLGQGRENAKTFLTENPEVMVEVTERVRQQAGIGVTEDEAAEAVEAADPVAPFTTADDVADQPRVRLVTLPRPGHARHARRGRRGPGHRVLRVARLASGRRCPQDGVTFFHTDGPVVALFGWDDLGRRRGGDGGSARAFRGSLAGHQPREPGGGRRGGDVVGRGRRERGEGSRGRLLGWLLGLRRRPRRSPVGGGPQPVHPVPGGRHARPAGAERGRPAAPEPRPGRRHPWPLTWPAWRSPARTSCAPSGAR